MHELVYVLPALHFSVDLIVSIILIRRGYWCPLLHVVLLVIDIQIIMRKVSVLSLSRYNYYVRTLLIIDILSRFQDN